MKTWGRTLGVITLALLLGVQPASALDRQSPEPQVLVITVLAVAADDSKPAERSGAISAELEDAKALARDLGISVDAAVARTAGQNEFLDLVEKLRSDPKAGFVDAEWNSNAAVPGVVTVNRPLARKHVEAIAASGGATVLIRPTLMDEASRMRAMEDAGDVLHSMGYYDATILAASDLQGIEIELPPSVTARQNGQKQAPTHAVAAARAAVAAKLPPGLAVNVRPVEAIEGTGPEYRGGFEYGGCTAAFVVKSGSKYGISTAGHCPWDTTYDGATFAASPQQGTVVDLSNRDVKWGQSLSGSAQNLFRASSANIRNVWSAANPVVGASVCKYGLTTGQTCSTVYKANFCRTSGAGTECGFYAVQSGISSGGDSGGPWYWGSKAMGIHSGTYPVDGASRSTFTGISALSLANATVYIG